MNQKNLLLTLLVLVMYALHQDFWNWRKIEPLVFGFLPVGLAYHVAYSILAAVTRTLLVKFAWPKHLEEDAERTRPPGDKEKRP